LNGRTIGWRLDEDRRLKKIHLQVHPQEGLIIRAPVGTPPSTITDIFKSRTGWLLSYVDEMSRQCPRREYADGELLPLLGEIIRLKLFWQNSSPKAFGQWSGNEVHIILPRLSGEQRDAVRDCLINLYREKATDWFPDRVKLLNVRHFGQKVRRITIKSQARILGSCSSLGNLNFQWRLILAPVEVVDYVIIHELAHMEEMNHSKKFWRVVENACPDFKEHRTWLRNMNRTLYI